MCTVPGCGRSPSIASRIVIAHRRSRIWASKLGASRWRCWTTTTGAGKSDGSADSTCVSALRPPAEVAMTTIRRPSLCAISRPRSLRPRYRRKIGADSGWSGPAAARLPQCVPSPVHDAGGRSDDEVARRRGRGVWVRMRGRHLLGGGHQLAHLHEALAVELLAHLREDLGLLFLDVVLHVLDEGVHLTVEGSAIRFHVVPLDAGQP